MSYADYRPWYPRFGKVGRRVGNTLKWPVIALWAVLKVTYQVIRLIYRVITGKQRFIWDG